MKEYRTILIDPPYCGRGGDVSKRGADMHYPVLKTKDIVNVIKKSGVFTPAKTCHLYLWVTNNFLPDGLFIIKELGFRYITNIVWVKDKFGLGFYFRGQHELCLFASKGVLLPIYKDFQKGYWALRWKKEKKIKWTGANQKFGVKTPTTVIFEKRKKHSQKPIKMYNLIETVSPKPRLEMFARERREGWDVWGNEIPKSLQKQIAN